MDESSFQSFPFPDPADAAIAFALVSVFYLAILFLTLFIARREFKLVLLGLVTAVASIGYASLVGGGAILVAPTLMKLAVLLVLGGMAMQLLSRWERPRTPQEDAPLASEGEHRL